VGQRLGLPPTRPDLHAWEDLVARIRAPRGEVTIGIVGKYVSFEDSYKSLNEALSHGGFAHDQRVVRRWVEAEDLEAGGVDAKLAGLDGILVPGGFGARGTGGMVAAADFARRTGTPYFGICYGFQWAVTSHARHVCGLAGANSTEVDPEAEHKVVYKLQDLLGVEDMGGTMRLGAYPCELRPDSLAARAYGARLVSERHRHRYEFNQAYEGCLAGGGLLITGKTPDGKFAEIAEIPSHPWYVAVQFHPEFKSKPLRPHPLFAGFVGAALERRRARARATAGAPVTATPA
jgi:CTP synthase